MALTATILERNTNIMEKITIKSLKNELMETIANIDKDKVTVTDLKILAEAVGILSTIKEDPVDYMDVIMKMSSGGFGFKPTTVSDLKGDE